MHNVYVPNNEANLSMKFLEINRCFHTHFFQLYNIENLMKNRFLLISLGLDICFIFLYLHSQKILDKQNSFYLEKKTIIILK